MKLTKYLKGDRGRKAGGGSKERRAAENGSRKSGAEAFGTKIPGSFSIIKKEETGVMANREINGGDRSEKTLYSKKIITRNKAFFLDFKENNNGKFLKVTESSGDKRSFVFIPEEGIREFSDSLAEILQNHI
ncbi:MAG: hypothetical protein AB1742_02545 [bacterium]